MVAWFDCGRTFVVMEPQSPANPESRASDGPTVISAQEAADLLGIHRTTLYEAARRSEVPCRIIGRRFVFVRETLIDWMRSPDRDRH